MAHAVVPTQATLNVAVKITYFGSLSELYNSSSK
jgi:hypothetical protein